MVNGLLNDLDKNIPIGISICDKNGKFLKVHEYFKEIFGVENIETTNDIKKIKDLLDSNEDYINFYIKENVRNRYFRIDKNFVDDYIFCWACSEVSMLMGGVRCVRGKFDSCVKSLYVAGYFMNP